MIKKIAFVFLLSSLAISCSNDENSADPIISGPQVNCQLTTINVSTLTIDDIKIEGYNSGFTGKLHFDYDNQNRVIRIRGGLKATYTLGSLAPKWAYYDDITDTITYTDNVISVRYSNNSQVRPFDKEFTIAEGKIQSRKVTSYTGFSLTPVTYTYEYTDTGVVEKKDNVVYRTFTIDNGNLIKVERLSRHYFTGEIVAKEELIFGDYDTSKNWLKGNFFINGAFFKAFSANNYRTFARNDYIVENGIYVLQSDYSSWMAFGYDANNVAEIFSVDCH
jgi:hypothetical protein